MKITPKQERYARNVAEGMGELEAAMVAGCKNHESARKYVADMAKRQNVQDLIAKLKSAPEPGEYESPLEYLTAVFNNKEGLYSPKERISAAIALLPYTEHKLAQTGKKEDNLDKAQNLAVSSRFATASYQADIWEHDIKQ